MYRSRVIPILLLKDEYIVKTINFSNPKYVGEPINIVRIFNDKEADEICIFDIDASFKNKINFGLLENIATNARMPICYGGGINSISNAEKIFLLGVEKIAIGEALFDNEKIITDISKKFGSQSCAVTININYNEINNYFIKGKNYIYDKNQIVGLLRKIIDLGAGEIIINCIHRDGTLLGYDEELLSLIYNNTEIPFTFVGGASSKDNINEISNKFNMIGLGVGSLFIYKGKRKAVLINYLKR